MARETDQTPSVTEDGFGTRSSIKDPQLGCIERLDLTAALSTPASEQAIRARAAYHNTLEDTPIIGRVTRIARVADALSVFTVTPDGIPLSELLAGLEFKTISLSGEELLEVAGSIVTALATMHKEMRGVAHGALTPAHIVVQPDGRAILTGAVYGDALQALELNRESLWRDFGVALPTSASLPRFDQRGDVTQLGAVVLAIAQRRALRRDEYPKKAQAMAMAATVTGDPVTDSKLRTWLQDSLQLNGRNTFSSAVDAARAFDGILPPSQQRALDSLSLQAAIRQLCGEPRAAEDILPHQRAS